MVSYGEEEKSMSSDVQLNGRLPKAVKLRLQSVLVIREQSYSDWLHEQAEKFLAEQRDVAFGRRPARVPAEAPHEVVVQS
jgi:hypothetical protein